MHSPVATFKHMAHGTLWDKGVSEENKTSIEPFVTTQW